MQEIVVPEAKRDVCYCPYVDQEQHHVRDVELPNPFRQPSCADHEAVVPHYPPVDEHGGVARNENEKLSAVAEPIVPCRYPIDCIVWNVIEEDRSVGNSTQQIEAQVSTAKWKLGPDFHVLLAGYGASLQGHQRRRDLNNEPVTRRNRGAQPPRRSLEKSRQTTLSVLVKVKVVSLCWRAFVSRGELVERKVHRDR